MNGSSSNRIVLRGRVVGRLLRDPDASSAFLIASEGHAKATCRSQKRAGEHEIVDDCDGKGHFEQCGDRFTSIKKKTH